MASRQTWSWSPSKSVVGQIDSVAAALGVKRTEALRLVVAQGCAVMLEAANELRKRREALRPQADLTGLLSAFDDISRTIGKETSQEGA